MASVSQINFLQALGWALINSLWQMALLWVFYNLILSFFNKIKAAHKTSLATFFITIGFSWFLLTFINSLLFNQASDFYNKWSGILNENNWLIFQNKVLVIGTIIYFLVLIIPVIKFIRNYRYVQVIRNQGLSKIKAEWRIFVKRKSEYMGIARKVQIWLSDIVKTPVTIGFLKPIILIPVAAINHLSSQQVEAIILHELSHIRRYDYLFNLAINVIKTVLYFNPFVKLFVNIIERERENSCDEMVLQFQYQAGEYATALLLLEKNNKHQIMMAAAGKDHDLLHRIEIILGIHNKSTSKLRQAIVSLFTLLGIACMNIFLSLNSTKENNSFISLRSEINPYYFYNSKKSTSEQNAPKLFALTNSKPVNLNTTTSSPTLGIPDKTDIVAIAKPEDFKLINYTTPVIPELAKEEEMKLKETLGATKRILEEKEWKEIEKSYAEVYNSAEKAKLKDDYQKEVNKIDWNKLEDKLRISYNNIDWPRVNEQVNTSLNEICLDSLQNEVKIVFNSLTSLENWMQKNKTTTIPDTDVTLDVIKSNQEKAKIQLEKIKAIRDKKIISL